MMLVAFGAPLVHAQAPSATKVSAPAGEVPAAPPAVVAEKQPDGDTPKAREKKPVASPPAAPAATGKPVVAVSSWGGAYGDAQQRAVIDGITGSWDFTVERRPRANGAPDFSADVVELDQMELRRACASGQVVSLKPLMEEIRGTGEDFLLSAADDCGVPTFAWSSLVVANTAALRELNGRRYREPSRMGDVFDAARFKGKRAFMKSPVRLLEMGLLADGVKPAELYATLATINGQDRAFRRLDEIAGEIIWFDDAKQAFDAVEAGDAVFGMAFSGRVFRRDVIAGRIKPIWDGHLIDYAAWAVPAAAKRGDQARQFIRLATAPERLAAQATLWPYGPLRKSAVTRVGRHPALGIDLAEHMPTSDALLKEGVFLDGGFWATNETKLRERFKAWLDGVPLGIRVPPPRQAPSQG